MAASDAIRIAQISDLHCGGPYFEASLLERAIGEVNELAPDIVVCSGDLTTFGFRHEYLTAREYLDRIDCDALVVVPGNHDSRNVGYVHFEEMFGERNSVLRKRGVAIVAVDSSEPDLDHAVRHLIYGRTKVCGLTRPEHARMVQEAGATHGGLVFAAESPRRVTEDRAAHLKADIPLEWVGVFADQDPAEIAGIARRLDLAAVQLHGNESDAGVRQVRAALPSSCEVWKACPVSGAIPSRANRGADRLLLDSPPPDGPGQRRGGWGATFDWRLLEDYPERDEVVLAGGLRAENVADAATRGTWALDVSSGVESAPGEKDPMRLAEFFGRRRQLPGRRSS